jgi:hypothetical protein
VKDSENRAVVPYDQRTVAWNEQYMAKGLSRVLVVRYIRQISYAVQQRYGFLFSLSDRVARL